MRLIKVNAPEGQGKKIIEIAQNAGIKEAVLHRVELFSAGEENKVKDVVELQSSTPEMKAFIDSLLGAPFFNPKEYTYAIREPRSIVKYEDTHTLTNPVVIPDTDVYEELYQFSLITYSFVGRVLVAAILLVYGMIKMNILSIVSALIFLPYVHQMLSTSFGLSTREWGIARQGLKALLTATALIVLAGAVVAFIMKEPLRYQEYGTPLTGFIIAFFIGIASGLATSDDSGRKELIGLAITSQTTIFPAWFGISLVLGFPGAEKTTPNILSYFINMLTIIVTSGVTYRSIGMGKESLKKLLGMSPHK